jgi:hypothetical protein
VTFTCTLDAACQRLGQHSVNVFGSFFAAIGPAWLASVGKLVPDNQLVKRGQRQMPNGLLQCYAVFTDPRGEAKLPSWAGL